MGWMLDGNGVKSNLTKHHQKKVRRFHEIEETDDLYLKDAKHERGRWGTDGEEGPLTRKTDPFAKRGK